MQCNEYSVIFVAVDNMSRTLADASSCSDSAAIDPGSGYYPSKYM